MLRKSVAGAVLIALCGFGVESSSPVRLNSRARLDFIRRAQIWTPTPVGSMDIRTGPAGRGAFQPDELVTCDYVEEPLTGTSRKFKCAMGDDVLKVRYGATNGEVEGAVLATRLLWALGFVADRVYPVLVRCRGCSSDPWNHRAPEPGGHMFDPAVIERHPPGHEMDAKDKGGWSWAELDLVDERLGGASDVQRDALKLLAAFMQHTDTKPVQQRLLCGPEALHPDGECTQPFMFTHDVGLTFGRANAFNHASIGSVNFVEWSRTPVWRGATGCQAHLAKSNTGTLDNPRISEEGRQFLADLLVQLTDKQLRDLFTVAHVERRPRDPNQAGEAPATIDEWVSAFQRKRSDVVNRRCTTTS